MSDPHGEDRLPLEYLIPGDENRVTNALGLTRSHRAQIPHTQFELLEHTLRTLCAWQMPAKVLLAAIGYYLSEHHVFTAQELESLIKRDGHQLTITLKPLLRPCAEASDKDDLKRAYRCDRLRRLYQVAYMDVEPVLLTLATHIARMQFLPSLDRPSARMLAEDNESSLFAADGDAGHVVLAPSSWATKASSY